MEDLKKTNVEEKQLPASGWDIMATIREKERERAARVEKAAATATDEGQEQFDFKKFSNSYWRKGAFVRSLAEEEDNVVVEEYREQYYLGHPEVKTIEEFARALEKRDEGLGE